MYYTVYKITNKINNKEYIGAHQTHNLDDGYMGSGIALKHAYKKYGRDNFQKEIIHICESANHMFSLEASLVNNEYIKRDDTYNLMVGGCGAQAGELNPFYGKSHTLASIEKNKQTQRDSYQKGYVNPWKGKKHSQEQKDYWSSIRKGTRTAENNAFYGKTHSIETKEKIAASWETTRESRIAGISKALSRPVTVFDATGAVILTFNQKSEYHLYCKENGFPRSILDCTKEKPYNPKPKRHYKYTGWYSESK